MTVNITAMSGIEDSMLHNDNILGLLDHDDDEEEFEGFALLNLSSWCPVMVERLFLPVPQGCLRFVIVVFPDHTHHF